MRKFCARLSLTYTLVQMVELRWGCIVVVIDCTFRQLPFWTRNL